MMYTRNSSKRLKAAVVDKSLFNNDILLSIAPFLDCNELVNLSITCRRLGSKLDHDRSLVEEVARQMINKSQTEEERDALPRYGGESWIALLHELELLRSPLTFDQLIGDGIEYVNGDRSCITTSNDDFRTSTEEWSGNPQTAMCSNHIMRKGKHYATFTITGSDQFAYFFGVTRPVQGWDKMELGQFSFIHSSFYAKFREERTSRWGKSNVNCCMYDYSEGCCSWCDWQTHAQHDVEWVGMEGVGTVDGKVGMLLDLDEGTLAVYKDGRRLGVMKDGLSGEYCWVTTSVLLDGDGDEQNVRLERGCIPTS